MKSTHNKLATFAATIITFGALAGGVNGATLILDSTNGYSVTVAPGFTISQPFFTGVLTPTSPVEFSGATAALGTALSADFSANTFTSIGGGGGGNGPVSFANNATEFTLRDDTTQQLYDATITFARSANNPSNTGGTAPSPDNNAGLVIEIVAVPEPSSAILLGVGALGFTMRRRRAK